ncbi:MAG TPA: zf-TFIIB domain-containing protein [Pyrinomonadaceae bacterium]|nr:zf-TFIIB domain-containing protein [Pyrinomonadaceae bacterium]
MNCPVCANANLVMSERQGIEIDYCPQCRGVWLDRGELDKIIDRSVGGSSGQRSDNETRGQSRDYKSSEPYREPSREHHREGHHEGHYKKKKREGFLSDLFDFD